MSSHFFKFFILRPWWRFAVAALILTAVVALTTAVFLEVLDLVTQVRTAHLWIVALLPLGGGVIGYVYYKYGSHAAAGHNLIIRQTQNLKTHIPLRMAPLVLVATWLTHLVGGSAGREGTAVQAGGVCADALGRWFGLASSQRRMLLLMGVAAGFAAVFGTPLAGAVFAFELLQSRKWDKHALLPTLVVAFAADALCRATGITHHQYNVTFATNWGWDTAAWCVAAGLAFGMAAFAFVKLLETVAKSFNAIKYPPLRPVAGGLVLLLATWALQDTQYLGLGLSTLADSFTQSISYKVFFIKMLFTACTLGSGFKGGEVTPLFFIGATLGNSLSVFVPLPPSLLAGMGFIAVFSGATHAPLACMLLGAELFGWEGFPCWMLACTAAYLSSGSHGIYKAQRIGGIKRGLYHGWKRHRRKAKRTNNKE